MGLKYDLTTFGEVEIRQHFSVEEYKQLNTALSEYGIEIVESQKSVLVQKIKDVIIEMIYLEEKLPASKISHYLTEKLNHSYGYLANLFSEVTYTSIENFIILQKIELVKELIISEKLTLTEISIKLNYSSVAHLSNQFKKTTGLTPSMFQRIIEKRNRPAQ